MERTIPDKETINIEFKSDKTRYPDAELFEAVVAFSNTDGGVIYLGVENDGEVTGVHPSHSNPETLGAYIANNTVPPVSVRAEIIEDIFPVLKITVPKSSSGITSTASGKILRRRLKADGEPENTPMYSPEIMSRLGELRAVDYSATVIHEATLDDIDKIELENLRHIIQSYNGEKALLELSDQDLLKALGFVRDLNDVARPTIAGLLMCGKVESLFRFVPTHKSSFQVTEGTSVRNNVDFVFPVLSSIEKLNDYISVRNEDHELEVGLFRMSIPDFDKRAVREALVNAFSHRDYSKMGRVRVELSDDGLTIANPGGFIEGININNLLSAEPQGRNPLLADALKRVGLAEKTGRGIDRIFEGSLLYGKALPDYSLSTSVNVSLFIPKSNVDTELAAMIANEQNRIGRALPINTLIVLNTLRDMPKSNIKEIADTAHLLESAVKVTLDRSISAGLVEGFGTGRGKTYMLSHNVFKNKSDTIGYVRQRDIDEVRYKELILNLAERSDFISNSDIRSLLHVESNKAYLLLKELSTEGKLIPVNKGRYSKYRLAAKVNGDNHEEQ